MFLMIFLSEQENPATSAGLRLGLPVLRDIPLPLAMGYS